jgi:hypothetical protein
LTGFPGRHLEYLSIHKKLVFAGNSSMPPKKQASEKEVPAKKAEKDETGTSLVIVFLTLCSRFHPASCWIEEFSACAKTRFRARSCCLCGAVAASIIYEYLLKQNRPYNASKNIVALLSGLPRLLGY